jgi:hypothetical protein
VRESSFAYLPSKTAERSWQHALQHGIPATEMMIKSRGNMHNNQKDYEPTDPTVDCEQLRR